MSGYDRDPRRADRGSSPASGSDTRSPGKRTRAGALPGPGAGARTPAKIDDAVARAEGSLGQPLPQAVRDRFEASLGADLSGVRVHTGPESDAAAEAVDAKRPQLTFDELNAGHPDLLALYHVHQALEANAGQLRPLYQCLRALKPDDKRQRILARLADPAAQEELIGAGKDADQLRQAISVLLGLDARLQEVFGELVRTSDDLRATRPFYVTDAIVHHAPRWRGEWTPTSVTGGLEKPYQGGGEGVDVSPGMTAGPVGQIDKVPEGPTP